MKRMSSIVPQGSADPDFLTSLFRHSFSQGFLEGIQGGNMFHGFMMGAVAASGGYMISEHANSLGKAGMIASNAILSGTVAEIGGGKFANGAVTGAFSVMFNEMMHHHFNHKRLKKIYQAYLDTSWEERNGLLYLRPIHDVCMEIGGSLGEMANEVENGCAIRLSYAMNKGGMQIPNIAGQTYKGSDGNNYFIKASELANYLRPYYIGTIHQTESVRNAIVFIHKNVYRGVTGHVDVVFKGQWGASYRNSIPVQGRKDAIVDVFH